MSQPKTSVTDQPVRNIREEDLGVGQYAQALVEFIAECSTPLTIGIQGEWGSGKTSLMYMIRDELTKNNVASAWVNTWEFSMFRETEETTPAVMQGLLEDLENGCSARGGWPDSLTDNFKQVKSVLKNVARFAVNAAGKQVTGQENLANVADSDENRNKRAEIAEIKNDISQIIKQLIEDSDNPYNKVIFFVDDLDRIEPPIAVNILESLKNLFDIENCVFLLAIDYDVVVKGLKDKFGEKTEENDREFRSFFDKIIQVPFSMPISAYNIDCLVRARFNELGFHIDNESQDAYETAVRSTVGGNPRSIKRFINTYSLLRRIRTLNANDAANLDAVDDFVLFSLIGIQIAFPRLYQLLVKNPDFVNWDEEFADRNGITIDVPAKFKDDELIDELWEQIVWSFCNKETRLRVRSRLILEFLNFVRGKIGDDNVGRRCEDSLQITNITSVDDDEEANEKKSQRVRYDNWDSFSKVQFERGVVAKNIEIASMVHDFVIAQFGADNIHISYAPGMISYTPIISGNKTNVFLYSIPQKRKGVALICVGLKGSDNKPPKAHPKRPEDINDDVRAMIISSYQGVVDG